MLRLPGRILTWMQRASIKPLTVTTSITALLPALSAAYDLLDIKCKLGQQLLKHKATT